MDYAKSIKKFLVKELGYSNEQAKFLTDETRLLASGVLDSLTKMKLIVHLEKTYDVVVEAEDVDAGHLDSIAAIEKFISSRKKAA